MIHTDIRSRVPHVPRVLRRAPSRGTRSNQHSESHTKARRHEDARKTLRAFAPSCETFASIIALFCLGATAFASDVIRISKPVSESIKPDGIYWNFDQGKLGEADPNPVQDESGNELEGFLLSGTNGQWPAYVEGKFGTGIRLQGTHPTEADPRVIWNAQESPGRDGALLTLAGRSFTAGAWIKFNNPDEDAVFVVFERGVTAGETGGWNFCIYRSADKSSRLRVHLPGAYKDAPLRGIDLGDGEWHHVGLSLEQQEGAYSILFWLDGEPVGEPISVEGEIPPVDEGRRSCIFTVGERNVGHHYSRADVSVDDVFVTSGIHRFEP